MIFTNDELLKFLTTKLVEAQQALAARKQMERTWASGSSQSWRQAGCRRTKVERMETARAQGRIAEKCLREVEMLKAVITQFCEKNCV